MSPMKFQQEGAIKILELIQGIVFKFGDQHQEMFLLTQSKKRVYLHYQKVDMSTDRYLEEIKALVAVVESHGGGFSEPGTLRAALRDTGVYPGANGGDPTRYIIGVSSDDECAAVQAVIHEKLLTDIFISGANKFNFAELNENMAN